VHALMFDGLLENVRQQLEDMGLDDFTKTTSSRKQRPFLDKDCERFTRELSELAARGMRTDEALN
jgi:hypothetical protein